METGDAERSKRLCGTKLKESLEKSLDKIKLSLQKSITERLDESPILGSIRNSSLSIGKSKLPSLFDSYKSPFGTGLSRGINSSLLQPLTLKSLLDKNSTTMPVATESSAPVPQIGEQIVGGAHDPIVLPDYLMDKDEKKEKKYSFDRITSKQLREAANLRNEIKHAVKHNIYVHSASEIENLHQKNSFEFESPKKSKNIPLMTTTTTTTPSPPAPPARNNFETDYSFQKFFGHFWENFIGGQNSRKLSKSYEQSLGSARSDFSYVTDEKPNQSIEEKIVNPVSHDGNAGVHMIDEGLDDHELAVQKMMKKAAEQMMNQGIVSNTVESYVNGVDAPYVEVSQVREELNMTSITEDTHFKIGESVIGWRTLQRNKRESHALIGITNTSIILVLENNGIYKLQVEQQLLSMPTFFTVFTYWNKTQHSIDGIVIVSIQREIVFFRVNEAMDQMEMIWMWPMHSVVKYVNHFVIDNSDTLLVITDLHGGSAASLYRFDVNERVFFLRQSLMLKTPAKNMALIQSGYETFMCFPQEGHVVIYKYAKEHFIYFTQIESKNADILITFEMGGYSYLAIGGHQAKILRYHLGKFLDQTILSKSWGLVEFFLPVPARTFRDDLILFVQHRMDYGSHTNSFIEALIWNGHAFHPALQVPCYINNRESESGLGCILDEDRELGIIGATVFQRNRTISILVPRHEAPSGLFDLEIDLLPAVSTMNEHLLELLSEVIILIETRAEVLKNARDVIDRFPKGPMNEVTIKNQNIDTIRTEDLDLGTIIPNEGIYVNDELITKEIVDEFLQLLNETETSLRAYDEIMRTKRDDNDVIESLQVETFDVDHLIFNYINDIPAEDLVFVEDGNLKLDGMAVLSQPIEAKHVERLNDDYYELRQEAPGVTIIDGDLTFEEINGIKWKDFINQIVLKNLPNNLDEINITGVSFIQNLPFLLSRRQFLISFFP